MNMLKNKPTSPTLLPKEFHQIQYNASLASTSPGLHTGAEPLASLNSGDTAMKELVMEINKKVDQAVEAVKSFDIKISTLNSRTDMLEDLIHSLARSASSTYITMKNEQTKAQVRQHAIDCLVDENKHLGGRIEQIEKQVQPHALCICGLPEEEEGQDLEVFLEKWLPAVLKLDTRDDPIVVQRAYRVSGKEPKTNANQGRTVVARLAEFRDKERILQQVQKLKTITYKNKPILIFPDIPKGKEKVPADVFFRFMFGLSAWFSYDKVHRFKLHLIFIGTFIHASVILLKSES